MKRFVTFWSVVFILAIAGYHTLTAAASLQPPTQPERLLLFIDCLLLVSVIAWVPIAAGSVMSRLLRLSGNSHNKETI